LSIFTYINTSLICSLIMCLLDYELGIKPTTKCVGWCSHSHVRVLCIAGTSAVDARAHRAWLHHEIGKHDNEDDCMWHYDSVLKFVLTFTRVLCIAGTSVETSAQMTAPTKTVTTESVGNTNGTERSVNIARCARAVHPIWEKLWIKFANVRCVCFYRKQMSCAMQHLPISHPIATPNTDALTMSMNASYTYTRKAKENEQIRKATSN
jgi:hypothetical protein